MQPKHTHLNKLHRVIAQIADVVVNDQAQLHNYIPLKWWDGSRYVDGIDKSEINRKATILFYIYLQRSSGIIHREYRRV